MRTGAHRRQDFPIPHLFRHHFPFYVQWERSEAMVVVLPDIHSLVHFRMFGSFRVGRPANAHQPMVTVAHTMENGDHGEDRYADPLERPRMSVLELG